jgi:hypothetical protein
MQLIFDPCVDTLCQHGVNVSRPLAEGEAVECMKRALAFCERGRLGGGLRRRLGRFFRGDGLRKRGSGEIKNQKGYKRTSGETDSHKFPSPFSVPQNMPIQPF